MSINKKAFGLVLSLAVAASVNVANAQATTEGKNEVLFKIHDIVPVKNESGVVTACDFNTTIYNRSSYTVKSAELDFGWVDSSIKRVIEEEKKPTPQNNRRRGVSETENTTPVDLSTAIVLDELAPQGQRTITHRVETDRCFLLVEDVDFQVRSCSLEGAQAQSRSARRTNMTPSEGCSQLFKFVSPADPQFYQDFKEITLDEQSAQLAEQKKAEQEDINNMYMKALTELDAAGSIAGSIK